MNYTLPKWYLDKSFKDATDHKTLRGDMMRAVSDYIRDVYMLEPSQETCNNIVTGYMMQKGY